METNLVVDIGNTRIKLGRFIQGNLTEVFYTDHLESLPQITNQDQYKQIIIASVVNIPEPVEALLRKKDNILFVDAQLKIPFDNQYQTKQTLGADRIALVAGGRQYFPSQNLLIIDFGSCITYDLLTEKNSYLGGGISPGLRMRLRAMHTFTGKLPLVNTDDLPNSDSIPLIGTDTKTNLLSGAVWGIIAEINQMIRMYKDKFADLQVILSGGDASFFENNITAEKKLIPELVLFGLNSLLSYNVLQK